MTPLHANILLHYYVTSESWQDLTSLHSEYVADLMSWGLINSTQKSYETTDKGKALIEYWLNMPFPECKWIIPSP